MRSVIFAIGDIHGCANELRQLLNQLPQDPDTTFVFLGDYVDRGPDSAEVLDTILELSQRFKVVALMGNHESMFLDFLRDPESREAAMFVLNGGSATLASYSKTGDDYEVPDEHLAFLSSLQIMHTTEQYVFVHAGLPQIPLIDIDPEDDEHMATMLWTRGRFLKTAYDWGKVVVHGHTPVRRVTQWPNRINIDTGCVYDGRLTALALPGEARFSVRRKTQGPRILLRDPRGVRQALRFHGEVPVRVKRDGGGQDMFTVDYSELGMYLRAADQDAPRFAQGERIEGTIGPDDASAVTFRGVVVRTRIDEAGVHYGIKIDDTRANSKADSRLTEDDSSLDDASVIVKR